MKITDWKTETEHRVARAMALFKEGHNCAQSVAMTFADFYGIDSQLMARLSASFGGGIGRMRETCGAACGMFLLAGLEVGDAEDRPQSAGECAPYPDALVKKKNYEVVQQLAQSFRQQAGSLLCRELLGLAHARPDGSVPPVQVVATPEARTEGYYKRRPCVEMVAMAVRIYMQYLQQKYDPASRNV